MDPQETWGLFLDALENGEEIQAMECAGDLLRWMAKGGFAPQIVPGRKLPEKWSRAVIQFACEAAFNRELVGSD